jgi:hypothetical protein
MSSEHIKEARRVLRLVQAHVTHMRLLRGASSTLHGFVEVVTHPADDAPLNLVTPRKNTAWVAAIDIAQGLEALRALGRAPRFAYVEGLFPPQFASSLTGLGLRAERETPVMVRVLTPQTPPRARVPRGLTLREAASSEDAALWSGERPEGCTEFTDAFLPPAHFDDSLTLLLIQRTRTVGAARLTFNLTGAPDTHTACIERLMLCGEASSDARLKALVDAALSAAHTRGAVLVMVPGPQARPILRDSGFYDCGSVICYGQDLSRKDPAHGRLEQPVLTLR